MALIDNSTTFTGKEAEGFYSLALLTGGSKEYFHQMANVKSKAKIASLELGGFLQTNSCEVEESGDHTIDDQEVEVCDIAYNIPVCEKDYEGMYLSLLMKPGSNVEQNFPNGLIDYIMNRVADQTNEATEALAWQGDTALSPPDATLSLCDGILKGLLADSDVKDVQSPVTLSESNIVAEMIKAVKTLPKTIKNMSKTNVKFFMSIPAASYFEMAMYASTPAIYAYNRDEMRLQFMGYEIIVSPGMPDNTFVLCNPENLIYATDLAVDEKTINFVKNPMPGAKKKWNIVGEFKIGFTHIKGAEIVLYGTGS